MPAPAFAHSRSISGDVLDRRAGAAISTDSPSRSKVQRVNADAILVCTSSS